MGHKLWTNKIPIKYLFYYAPDYLKSILVPIPQGLQSCEVDCARHTVTFACWKKQVNSSIEVKIGEHSVTNTVTQDFSRALHRIWNGAMVLKVIATFSSNIGPDLKTFFSG